MQSAIIYLVAVTHSFLMLNFLANSTELTKRHNDDTIVELKKTSLCDYCGGPKPLGMESGVISDDDLTVSSSYNQQSVGLRSARLNKDISGGAWCPAKTLSAATSGEEWIQVDLRDLFIITSVATQGRFGNGVGVEFTEEFWLEYSRDNGTTWFKWTDQEGNHKLPGNTDAYSVVKHELSHPLVGINLIRIVPFAYHSRTSCLRFELYGCRQQNLPITYSMPDGFKSGIFGDLIDMTYDGKQDNYRYLSGGIGQLVDGVKGDDNYKVNKGYEWIGWKSDGETESDLQIIFQFQNLENFTSANFYCHNLYTKDMQVFSSAKIWFSFDGKVWSKKPVDFSYMADNVIERARDVVIHLHHRIGKYVKFDLRFAKKWLLISEVSFDLSTIEPNYTENFSHLESPQIPVESLIPITTAAINSNRSLMSESLVLIVFGVVFTLIFTASIVMLRLHMRRKEKSGHIVVCMKDLATTPLYCEPKDLSSSGSSSAGDPDYAVPDVALTNVSNNNTTTTTSVPSITSQSQTYTPKHVSATNPLLAHHRYYASTDVIKSPKTNAKNVFNKRKFSNEENSSLKLKYSNGITDAIVDVKCIPQISEDEIILIRSQFGSSKFGEIAIAKYKFNIQSQNDELILDETLVILKALRNDKLKNEFFHEMKSKWFISAKSERIAKLFGFINTSNYTAMVLEVGDCDLNHFLRNCDTNTIGYSTLIYIASEVASGMKYLETLGYVHKDIAARNVLVYTTNLLIKIGDSGAHAAANKIDYYKGMAIRWASPESLMHGRFTSKSDVYSFGVTLWEILTYCSIKPFHNLDDETFLKAVVAIYEQTNNIDSTNKTIYYQPFSDGSNQKLLALPRPDGCPKEIYDLMLECWQINDVSRPAFREISLFLNRKTIGFQKPSQV